MSKKKQAAGGVALLLGAAVLVLYLQNDKQPAKQTTKSAGSNPLDFLRYIKPYAIALSKKIGVPALFIMAQIALETNFGKSILFSKYWNVGGIKATAGQKFFEAMTWEYVKDKNKYPRRDASKDLFDTKKRLWKIRVPQKFAAYENLPAGLVGYSGILRNKYFNKYTFKTTDAKKYVALLQSGTPKYATDINYVPKIHKLIDFAAMAGTC
jgi:flagellum-specific peptidoglycan hydrolase FlgJ